MHVSRRHFLRWTAAAGALGLTSRYATAARVALGPALATGTGNLLLLQLSGGNDGLSMVVPYGDDAYHRERPTLAKQADELVTLDKYRGLHKDLVGGIQAWEAGELAIVEGCGYPNPNRSHFKSMDIWHTADPRGRGAGQGWIGRLADAVWKQDVDVNRILHIGGEPPYSLTADVHGCAAFDMPEGYRWLDHDDGLEEYSKKTGDDLRAQAPRDAARNLQMSGPEEPMQRGDTLDAMRKVLNRARASSAAVRAAALGYRTEVEYPRDALGSALRTAASLLKSDLGSRVVSVTYGGFDTHNDGRNRHDRQMRELGAALAALRSDLAGSTGGDATTILIFSEFGRRVTENGSKGTDHGTAGPVLVMGPRIKGGLYGKHPKLSGLDKGDTAFTTDFRRVYTDVAMHLFDAPKDVLGEGFKPLGLYS